MSEEGLGVLEMEVLEGEVGLHDAGGLHPGPQHILLGGDVVGPGYPLQVIQVAGEGAEGRCVSRVVGQGTSRVLGDILGVAPGTLMAPAPTRLGNAEPPAQRHPPPIPQRPPAGWEHGDRAVQPPGEPPAPPDDAAMGTQGTHGDEAAAPGPAQP